MECLSKDCKERLHDTIGNEKAKQKKTLCEQQTPHRSSVSDPALNHLLPTSATGEHQLRPTGVLHGCRGVGGLDLHGKLSAQVPRHILEHHSPRLRRLFRERGCM